MRKINEKTFICRSIAKHADKYDYNSLDYKSYYETVKIICPIHGIFEQTPNNHIRSSGCPKCGIIKKSISKVNNLLTKKFEGIIQPEKYKIIPLDKGAFTKVDNDDFEYLSKINWHLNKHGYAHSRKGFIHRLIMNCPDDMIVDHKNHDTLDNRKENLRISNKSTNAMNMIISTKRVKTSKYKGVSWIKERCLWRASIMFNYKSKYIGAFDSEIEAAKAYDAKAKELFGEFAYTNF